MMRRTAALFAPAATAAPGALARRAGMRARPGRAGACLLAGVGADHLGLGPDPMLVGPPFAPALLLPKRVGAFS